MHRAVRQAGKAPSFQEASADLRELASVTISPNHLGKLAERVGREWEAARDADVQRFRARTLPPQYVQPPKVATVMVDGGRVQTREEGSGNGVRDPCWREVKVACCQSLSSRVHAVDPQSEPPRKFLDPIAVARLVAEIKARGGVAKARVAKEAPRPRRPRKRTTSRPRTLVRTVIASMANSDEFGWHVVAEVQRRGLGQARRKGYICDGQKYNWTLYEMHLEPQGFIGILDFVHLLVYLYGAAQAVEGKGSAAAWARYESWMRLAWSGRVKMVLAGLRQSCNRLGVPPEGCPEEDPRKVVAEALGYVTNNRTRMDYPRYRCLGLPISSAAVESVMKQVNQRMKGTEKFWLEGGAEAILQVRAAYLSEDGRAESYWSRPRPFGPAVGSGRLRPES